MPPISAKAPLLKRPAKFNLMSSSPLKIAFTDIVPYVEPFVLRWIGKLTVFRTLTGEELESERPDLVFYGDGKRRVHRRFRDSTRVCVTFENLYPDFSDADYFMAYAYVQHERYLRMPDWAIIHKPDLFLKDENFAERVMGEERDFCGFVASNGNPRRTRRRLEFFQKLNARHRVNSGGRVFNNVGGAVDDHLAFARKHKFYMAFENASFPGYTTEKIADGMVSGCVPIYWGDPYVALGFNPRSFINVDDFANDDDAINHVLRVDADEGLYREYLEQPFFHGNRPPEIFDERRILGFLQRILENPRPRRKVFSLSPGVFKMRRRLQPYLESVFGSRAERWNHTITPS